MQTEKGNNKAKVGRSASSRLMREPKVEQLPNPATTNTTLTDEQEQQQAIMRGMELQNSGKSVAFLTHNEALRKLLKQLGSANLLTNWTEDDCSGLLIQLSKYLCDEEGAKKIVRFFRDTTPGEIVNCFNECKQINKRAAQERCQIDSSDGNREGTSEQTAGNNKNYPNLSALMNQAKKSRGISDDSSDAISNFLYECSSDFDKFSDLGEPDYKLIYNHLASITQGYALKGLRDVDAAIILEIFEEMEREIDARPKLVNFLKQMFGDFQQFSKQEFKLGEELNEENAGQTLMNTLEFPDILLDLSQMSRINGSQE